MWSFQNFLSIHHSIFLIDVSPSRRELHAISETIGQLDSRITIWSVSGQGTRMGRIWSEWVALQVQERYLPVSSTLSKKKIHGLLLSKERNSPSHFSRSRAHSMDHLIWEILLALRIFRKSPSRSIRISPMILPIGSMMGRGENEDLCLSKKEIIASKLFSRRKEGR